MCLSAALSHNAASGLLNVISIALCLFMGTNTNGSLPFMLPDVLSPNRRSGRNLMQIGTEVDNMQSLLTK